ncbi:MAG TPA: hypothetical protein EYH56_00350 [Nanoarchaeota archaeon]|nr:hypothetical protein [Nanoarchaeota archaeon]
MSYEERILENLGEELYYFLNSIKRENYEEISPKIQCSCGGNIKISAYKCKEDEFLVLKAKCEECNYSTSMIFRPYEENVKRRLFGNEYFLTNPTALIHVSENDLEKIILGLEKGDLEIKFIELDKDPFLEAKLSPIKGTTLYSIYEMGKRKIDTMHIVFIPEEDCRYSLMFLDKDSEKKLTYLPDKEKKIY